VAACLKHNQGRIERAAISWKTPVTYFHPSQQRAEAERVRRDVVWPIDTMHLGCGTKRMHFEQSQELE